MYHRAAERAGRARDRSRKSSGGCKMCLRQRTLNRSAAEEAALLRCVLDRRTVLPLILCLVALTVGAAVSAQSVDDFAARLYTDAQGNTLPYRLFIPANYNPLVKYPLVLFLHGSGGSGSDNRKQLTDQTAPLVFAAPENQANWPCFM